MPSEIILVTAILCVAIYLLVTEKFPVDKTGLGIIVALMVAGLLTPQEAVSGFANPAPLAVGALFVVSRGLMRTGALTFVTRAVTNFTQGSRKRLLIISLLLVGILSAFLNNTPVVVLFMSIVMSVCVRYGFAPSRFLIPLSYISILAGTCTLIGTSTNILVSDVASSLGAAPITMFELSRLGVPLAIAGGAFMLFFADKLMPVHSSAVTDKDGDKGYYLTELVIPKTSRLLNTSPNPHLGDRYPTVKVYEVYRKRRIFDVALQQIPLQSGDFILARGSLDDISKILEKGDAFLPSCSTPECFQPPHRSDSKLVELLVPTNSGVRGIKLEDLHLINLDDVSIVGFLRRHEHYSWHDGASQRLRIGDILLVQTSERALEAIRSEEDFIILNDDVVQDVINWRRAPIAMTLFLGMVVAAASGLTDILTASFTASFGMLLTGCLSLREAYRAVDVKVLMLIIGTIALGLAMQRTGADALYAQSFLALFQGASPQVVLAGFIVLTSLLSHFLSNNSTAVLLVPIAMATAQSLGVDPRPFLIGVAFGASACYATPIGYQTNLIVYGPGGYTFSDFLRLGLPMVVIVCGGAALFIPTFWPF